MAGRDTSDAEHLLPDGEPAELKFADGIYSMPFQSLIQRSGIILSVILIPSAVFVFAFASYDKVAEDHRGVHPKTMNVRGLYCASVVAAILYGIIILNSRNDRNVILGKEHECRSRRWGLFLFVVLLTGSLPTLTFYSSLKWWSVSAEAYAYCARQCFEAEGNHTIQHECARIGLHKNITIGYKTFSHYRLTWSGVHECENIFKQHAKSSLYVKSMLARGHVFMAFESLLRQHYGISIVEIYWAWPMGFLVAVWLSIKIVLAMKMQELVNHREVYLKHNILNFPERILRYYENFNYLEALKNGNMHPESSNSKEKESKEWILKVLKRCRREIEENLENHDYNEIMADESTWVHSHEMADKRSKAAEKLQEAIEKIWLNIRDDNGDGQVDAKVGDLEGVGQVGDLEGGKEVPSCTKCSSGFVDILDFFALNARWRCLVIIFTVGHLAIPMVARWWLQSRGRLVISQVAGWRQLVEHSFAPDPVFTAALAANVGVSALALVLLWAAIFRAYVHYQGKLKTLLCFDCMWRFPDESPIDMVHYQRGPLRQCVSAIKSQREEDHNKDKKRKPVMYDEEKMPALRHVYKWHGHYRLDFSSRDIKEITQQIPGLNQWFNMRRYIQIDVVDERVALEMWSLLVLVLLLPSCFVVLGNLFLLRGKVSGYSQTVNIQVLWDSFGVCIVVLMVMLLTLQFNTGFARHKKQLSVLKDHLLFTYKQSVVSRGSDGDAATCASTKEKYEDLSSYLDAVLLGIDTFDKPATLFGFAVDSAVVGRFSTLGAGLATTQLLPIIMVLFKNLISDEKEY